MSILEKRTYAGTEGGRRFLSDVSFERSSHCWSWLFGQNADQRVQIDFSGRSCDRRNEVRLETFFYAKRLRLTTTIAHFQKHLQARAASARRSGAANTRAAPGQRKSGQRRLLRRAGRQRRLRPRGPGRSRVSISLKWMIQTCFPPSPKHARPPRRPSARRGGAGGAERAAPPPYAAVTVTAGCGVAGWGGGGRRLQRAVAAWSGAGRLVFTSSTGVYAEVARRAAAAHTSRLYKKIVNA